MLTPQPQVKKLSAALGLKTPLYFKREDLHSLKSHKGRSLPSMIDRDIKKGRTNFVISSSGNAALAAGLYVKKINIKRKNKIALDIFVGEKITDKKLIGLKKITDKNIKLAQTKNPKQAAFLAKKQGATLLRQSVDNSAPKGYAGLYNELRTIKNLKAIFVPTSSGTTAVGLYRACRGKISINIVQTDACHPFVKSSLPMAKKSLANAIVDKIGWRKKEILEALKKSRGAGYVATDKEIKNAIKLAFQTEKIKLSPNGALGLVGLRQALNAGWTPTGATAVIITGQ